MASERSKLKTRAKYVQICAFIVGITGIVLSVYAYHVETTAERDKGYKALCDISTSISCSKVLTSRYGRGFGLLEYVVGRDSLLNQPNSVCGVVFYFLLILLGSMPSVTATKIQIGLSALSICASLYLALILIYVLEDFCIVCVSTYIVNALSLVCSILKYRTIMSLESLKKSS